MENKICNYCKQKGHIKKDCNKIKNSNTNTRLIKSRYARPDVKPKVVHAEKKPTPEDVYKTDFPSLGTSDIETVKNSWCKESFVDVIKKVPIVEEEISTEYNNGMVFLN